MRNIRARIAENAQAEARARAESESTPAAEAHEQAATSEGEVSGSENVVADDADEIVETGTQLALTKPAKSKSKRKNKAPLHSHPAFVPMFTVWGAMLFGLSVLVAPAGLIGRFAALTGLGTGLVELGGYAAMTLAGIAALAGGVTAFGGAMIVKNMAGDANSDASVAQMATQLVRPIDAATELGSESLDSPIEEWPAADEAEPEHSETSEHVSSDPAPRELSLAEFAELGGRNAVWVEEPASEFPTELHLVPEAGAAPEEETAGRPEEEVGPQLEPQPEPEPEAEPVAEFHHDLAPETPIETAEVAVLEEAKAPPVVPAAVAKLRNIPPEELSLIQMVERFAVALHERQSAEQMDKSEQAAETRDAELAKALKALTSFTQEEHGAAGIATSRPHAMMEELQDTNRELREALTKLQGLSGAA